MVMESTFRKIIVVVMGSSASGVSRFVNQISELDPQTVPDPNPSDTLKPLDYGRLTVDDHNVIYLYGLSEKNPLSAWDFLFDRDDPVGVIALVDSTRPATFHIDKQLINDIDEDIPFLVAANKQDRADAWELDAIRIALSLPSTIPVMGCSAKSSYGVREVVLAIVNIALSPDEAEDEWGGEWDEDEAEEDDDHLEDTDPMQTSQWEHTIGAN